MNFTSLDSFSQQLAAAMLPLFSNSSTTPRDLHDNSWLLWQLAWLYRGGAVVSAELAMNLEAYTKAEWVLSEPSDRIRHAWMQQIGCPLPEYAQTAYQFHPAQELRRLLSRLFPEIRSPEDQLLQYLTCITGMPQTNASHILQWLISPEPLAPQPSLPPLIAVESYTWLTPEAVAAVLNADKETATLAQRENFHIIPLPTSVSRPASLMLTDGSLWLCWPETNSLNAPHPIVQATLVLHEASHLVKNAELFSSGLSSIESDTLWSSEDSALRAEWKALERLCAGQPEGLQKRFKQRWYEENHKAQLKMLSSDWKHYLEEKPQKRMFSAEELISLPFLSAVYAVLAEKIYR